MWVNQRIYNIIKYELSSWSSGWMDVIINMTVKVEDIMFFILYFIYNHDGMKLYFNELCIIKN